MLLHKIELKEAHNHDLEILKNFSLKTSELLVLRFELFIQINTKSITVGGFLETLIQRIQLASVH